MRRLAPAALLLACLALPARADGPPLPSAGSAGSLTGEGWVGHGFAAHVREAIALNSARKPLHAAASGGASECVSRRLVLLERLTLPYARLTDARAKKWNARGVGIVRDDFVPVAGAAAWNAPLRWRGQMTDDQEKALKARLKAYKREVKRLVGDDDFAGAARRSLVELEAIEALEAAWGCHLAMTKHIVEQTGFAAANAVLYVRQEPGVKGLARSFVKDTLWGFASSTGLDRRAQAAHARGAGVLVNDLPPIPLRAALRRAGL